MTRYKKKCNINLFDITKMKSKLYKKLKNYCHYLYHCSRIAIDQNKRMECIIPFPEENIRQLDTRIK